MRINRRPEIEILKYEADYGLDLVVNEMPKYEKRKSHRYTAQFKGIEVKNGNILSSNYGIGDTIDEALSDYASQISEELLVQDAYTSKRYEFVAPKLVHKKLLGK